MALGIDALPQPSWLRLAPSMMSPKFDDMLRMEQSEKLAFWELAPRHHHDKDFGNPHAVPELEKIIFTLLLLEDFQRDPPISSCGIELC